MPELAREAKPDAVIATGRSDYPNQVNNVLCFPFIFRGALDVGATTINREMELAAVRAIAELAQAEQSDIVALAYGEQDLSFGPEYLIPRPFDPRLIAKIAPAVAKAAMESGVATRPIDDLEAYRERLNQFVYQSGFVMKPVFTAAKQAPRRIVYAEGEEERDAARGAGRRRRRHRASDPDRPARRDRAAHRAARAAAEARPGLRPRRSRTAIRAIANTGPNTTASRRAAA